jgi:hypothetical protein
VVLSLAGGTPAVPAAALDALRAQGHPVLELALADRYDLGAEFFRWEFATAVAGVALGVNPFDEPNVTESKQNTAAVLERAHHGHGLPVEHPLAEEGGLRLYAPAGSAAAPPPGTVDLSAALAWLLTDVPPSGYVGICAYMAPTPARDDLLRDLRSLIRDRSARATTLGYGPRYLHSTGQLHKGGAPVGRFLQLVSGHADDLPIPGRRESFGLLIDAQALGDFAALAAHGLPILRIDLGPDADAGLGRLGTIIERALR